MLKYEKPLFHSKPRARDVYVTTRFPMTVYYQRVVHLLTHFNKDDSVKPSPGALTREKNTIEVPTSKLVSLHASGAAIKTALMILQDVLLNFPHLIRDHIITTGTTTALPEGANETARPVSTIRIELIG